MGAAWRQEEGHRSDDSGRQLVSATACSAYLRSLCITVLNVDRTRLGRVLYLVKLLVPVHSRLSRVIMAFVCG